MAPSPDQYRLNDAEHQAIFERDIKPALFSGAQPVSLPTAIIFGGQPGSGKSAALEMAKQDLAARGGAVEIIGDDLREFHPQYARLMANDDRTAAFYTDRDTGRWVEKSIAYAKAQRVNIVIEGTMRDGDKVAATMSSLRAEGYQIDARVLAVNARLSEQGILQRYENQKLDRGVGRMTTPEAHQAAYDGMPVTLERIEREKLADKVTIYRRGGESIYTNQVQGAQWVREPSGRSTLEAERARSMTLQERRNYEKGFIELATLLAKPERGASSEEIQKNDALSREARAMVASESFRTQTPEAAAREHLELAPASGFISSLEEKLKRDGLSSIEQRVVTARVRENLASYIERSAAPNREAVPECAPEKSAQLDRELDR